MENYSKKLEELISNNEKAGIVPTLLLHSCCAPCSSYCIEYLSDYFEITVFYYNPNIYPDEEYFHRVKEQERFISVFPTKYPVKFIEGDFEKDKFYETVKGYEKCEEGGERCEKCFNLRLKKTFDKACELGLDYYATTLTISPMKNAALLNEIGYKIADGSNVKWLPSDFKKKNGYKRSTEISKEYGMYRQNYCGCVFSVRE
ncbi:MAG: epoxyqueuosine reductase QueH [Lachnospiraceae bacterium]|nr:epoxyqueuosine reductase QueH [Lachnospiraceae bacterium]